MWLNCTHTHQSKPIWNPLPKPNPSHHLNFHHFSYHHSYIKMPRLFIIIEAQLGSFTNTNLISCYIIIFFLAIWSNKKGRVIVNISYWFCGVTNEIKTESGTAPNCPTIWYQSVISMSREFHFDGCHGYVTMVREEKCLFWLFSYINIFSHFFFF